jgi:cellulose biosynthesis protein BcsQ
MQIALLLPPDHPWREQLPSKAPVTDLPSAADLAALSRAPSDVVLAHYDLLTGNEDDLRRYRVARPTVRIVVAHPEALQPGDPLMAALVGLGIYDLVAETTPLNEVLWRPRTYADAARWHAGPAEQSMRTGGEVIAERTISRRRPSRLLIVWFSPAGGVGKSTGAVYVGTWIAASGLPVCLLELDEDKPGLVRWFGLEPPQRGLDDLPEELFDGGGPLREALRAITVRPGRNLALVPARGLLGGLQIKTKDHVSALLDTLLAEHAVVVADCPVRFKDAAVFYTLRRADHILLVADQNKVVLDALVRHLADSEALGIPKSRYTLVVNGYMENVGVSVAQIEAALGLEAAAVVPLEPAQYQRSLNAGKVFVSNDAPWAKLGQMLTVELEEEHTVRRPARAAARGGFLARLFRRGA